MTFEVLKIKKKFKTIKNPEFLMFVNVKEKVKKID